MVDEHEGTKTKFMYPHNFRSVISVFDRHLFIPLTGSLAFGFLYVSLCHLFTITDKEIECNATVLRLFVKHIHVFHSGSQYFNTQRAYTAVSSVSWEKGFCLASNFTEIHSAAKKKLFLAAFPISEVQIELNDIIQ